MLETNLGEVLLLLLPPLLQPITNSIQPSLCTHVIQIAAGCARRPDRADQLIAEFDGNAPANKNQVRKLSEQAGKPGAVLARSINARVSFLNVAAV